MPFDLKRIQGEITSAPLYTPMPPELAAAIVNDVFRAARATPVKDEVWARWQKKPPTDWGAKDWPEQLGALAHLLSTTGLREASVEALSKETAVKDGLEAFFQSIKPLTGEMIRGNAFRQEEFLRKWANALGGTIAGEQPADSARRLDQLDYSKALAEFKRAEDQRKVEAEQRAKAIADAAAAAAAAASSSGWRE